MNKIECVCVVFHWLVDYTHFVCEGVGVPSWCSGATRARGYEENQHQLKFYWKLKLLEKLCNYNALVCRGCPLSGGNKDVSTCFKHLGNCNEILSAIIRKHMHLFAKIACFIPTSSAKANIESLRHFLLILFYMFVYTVLWQIRPWSTLHCLFVNHCSYWLHVKFDNSQ